MMRRLLHVILPAVVALTLGTAWAYDPEPAGPPLPRFQYEAEPIPPPQKITRTLQGIEFTSDYDNGSLLDIQDAGANTFNATLYTESGELGTRKYWFRFRMSGVAGRTLTINIDHSSNPRPVVRVNDGRWRRMTSTEAPSSSRIVLVFLSTENFAEVAFFFPLGFQETYDTVSEIVRDCDDATTESIGVSFQGRPLWMARVTERFVPDTDKRRVWMHSRAHAGEATAVHVMTGFLRQVAENSPLGRHLRRHCIFNVVPLVNCDGVYLGHTRWDSQGIDPERQWAAETPIPEVAAMKTRIATLMDGPNPIEVALNLHSTVGVWQDTFFFKHVRPSVTEQFERIQQRYIDALANTTALFNNTSAQTSQLTLDPPHFVESYFWVQWGETVMAITHEGHFHRRITDGEYITDEDYEGIGRAMAVALIEYFQLPTPPDWNGSYWTLR